MLRNGHSRRRRLLVCGTCLLLAGCAGGGPRPAPVPDPPFAGRVRGVFADQNGADRRAALQPLAAPWTGALTMALTGTVDPQNAPLPTGDAERLAFLHLYETLTRIDARGEVVPSLATAWSSTGGGRTWILTLRAGASFWNGDPVTAAAVGAAWLASIARSSRVPAAPTPLAWLGLGEGHLRQLDNWTLALDLPEAMPDLPLVLAHPALAVLGRILPGDHWPQGSGPCRPADPSLAPESGLTLLPHTGHPEAPAWTALTLLLDPGPTGPAWPQTDLALVRGGASPPPADFQPASAVALPWDRLYFLVCPPEAFGTKPEDRQRWTADWSGRELAAALAESGRGAALPADTWTFYERGDRTCPVLEQPVPSWPWPDFAWPGRTAARDADLILFPEDDPLASELAGWFAEHAARPLRPGPDLAGRGPLTAPDRPAAGLAPQALGLGRGEFEAALQAGRAGAYVLPVDRVDGSDCRQLAVIAGRAHWLQEAAADPESADRPLPQGARAARPAEFEDIGTAERAALRLHRARILLPLVAGRATLWANPGLAGIAVDFNGAVDLTRAGYRR